MAIFDLFNKPSRGTNKKQDTYHSTNDTRYFCEDPSKPTKTAIIYQSELDYISRCILDYPDIETGGQLFGFWTAVGVPVIVYAIGPGKKAQHNPTSFIQDQNYLQKVGKELHKRYRLQHVGEWHSHHKLGLTHPSGGDVNTMQHGVGIPGFPRLLLCIGTCTRTHTTVNAFNFHENMPRDYVHAAWDIVAMDSPYRQLADMELQAMLLHPATRRASHDQIHSVKSAVQESESVRIHWLTESVDNVEIMKAFVSAVQSMYPEYVVKPEINQTGEPQITVKGANVSIKLPYGFPIKSPVLLKETGELYAGCADTLWEIGEEQLITTFRRWLTTKLPSLAKPVTPKSATADNCVYGSEDRNALSKDETSDYLRAKNRTERIGYENQLLSKYFHDNAFVWSEITENPVANIVAYPFREGQQGVIRMIMSADFPETPPEIQYGFYNEDSTRQPTLPRHLADIDYRNLSELFENGEEVYYTLLKWENDCSMFKAYIIACIILDYYTKAAHYGKDVMEYLYPFLDDDQELKDLTVEIAKKIKEQKTK